MMEDDIIYHDLIEKDIKHDGQYKIVITITIYAKSILKKSYLAINTFFLCREAHIVFNHIMQSYHEIIS